MKNDRMDSYIKIGKLLIAKKNLCKHGEFTLWVSENLDLKIRQCQRYMRIAKNSEKVKKCHSITQLMTELKE